MSKQFLIPIAWTITIGILCGMPGNTFPDLSFWKLLQFDSAAHAFVFMLFTFLWGVAFSKQQISARLKQYAIYNAGLSGILYGILIEILQYYIFIGRSCEFSDMISDAIGCIIGFFVFRGVYGKSRQLLES